MTFTAPLPPTRHTGDPVAPADDVNELTAAITELRNASGSGGAALDTTNNPQASGVASHGSSALASPADHVHPRADFQPSDHGLITWTYDPVLQTGTQGPTAGTLQLARVRIPVAVTVNNIILAISTAGATLTAGQCFAALYDAGRNLLGITADQSTNWTSTGTKIMPLTTPYAAAAGSYFVAFWSNGTTQPAFLRASNQPVVNVNLTGNAARFATSTTGLTTTAPNPAATLSTNSVTFWAALS